MEHIPSVIFDWIETKAFDSLTVQQQEEVGLYFSKEEYDELHQASQSAKYVEDMIEPDPLIEQRLLKHFDHTYGHLPDAKPSFMLYSVRLWKVAALFILLAGGALWIVIQAKAHREISYVTIRDTVYVPSFREDKSTIKVYDTVYMRKGNITASGNNENRHRIEVVKEEKESSEFVASSVSGIHLLSVKDKDAVVNRQKRNSLKEDTLLKQFKLVRL